MSCENVNLKELLKKAEEYDELKENRDYWEEECKKHEKETEEYHNTLKSVCAFLSELCQSSQVCDGEYWEFGINRHNVLKKLPEIFKMIADEKRQGFLLAQERRDNNQKFKKELDRLEEIYNRKAEELDFAWQKFRLVKTSRLQQTIDEINAEKI